MKQPNILFIVVDALRPRNLGCYGYSKPTSPNIDRLAAEGIVFENAFSCAISTTPSLTSIFSGRYPISHGITKLEVGSRALRLSLKRLSRSGTVFLPEILKSHGYTTLAVDWIGRWHKRGYDYYSGVTKNRFPRAFSLFRRLNRMIQLAKLPLRLFDIHPLSYIRGDFTTQEAIDLIRKVHNEKFFLFVHYWDTHFPYDPPKRFIERFASYNYNNDRSIEEVLAQFRCKDSWRMRKNTIPPGLKTVKQILERYDGAIAFVDHEVGKLVEVLDNYGILDETLIIFTSDHGESLTEHGICWTHHGLYDVTINVPLIFKSSHFPNGKKVEALVQHTDLSPTILDALGIENVSVPMDGKSLVPLLFNEARQVHTAVYVEEADLERKRAIRTENLKYICAESEKDAICRECGYIHGGIEEMYDLEKDPEENHNIAEENHGEKKKLKQELSKWVELRMFGRKKRRVEKEEKMPEYYSEEEKEIQNRLRELGYI